MEVFMLFGGLILSWIIGLFVFGTWQARNNPVYFIVFWSSAYAFVLVLSVFWRMICSN